MLPPSRVQLSAVLLAVTLAAAGGVFLPCQPCGEEILAKCVEPVGCVEVVDAPGCGCCKTCARMEGENCGVYTERCGSGLRCLPLPKTKSPFRALLLGRGMCTTNRTYDEEIPTPAPETTDVPPTTTTTTTPAPTKPPRRHPPNRHTHKKRKNFKKQLMEMRKMMEREKMYKSKFGKKPSSDGIVGLPFERRSHSKPSPLDRNRSDLQGLYNPLRRLRHRSRVTTEAPPTTTAQKPTQPPCRVIQRQVIERRRAEGSSPGFIPACDFDGFYRAKQCNLSTGVCWCVDKYGAALPSTPYVKGDPRCILYTKRARMKIIW